MEESVKKEDTEKTEKKEDENSKQDLTSWIEKHPKTVFWIRFVLWALCACILPFIFIVWRFELFKTISTMQIGGWGVIAIVIVAIFILTVIKYVKLAFSAKYSLTKQCLNGFVKVVLPFCVILVIVYSMRNNVELMIQVLGCVTVCEAVAIPINPLPKWAYESQKNVREEERKETVDYMLDTFFKKKKENSGKK